MEFQEIVHPTTFKIGDIFYKVSALVSLTDEQAAKIVMLRLRLKRPLKKDKGKTLLIKTSHDQSSVALL